MTPKETIDCMIATYPRIFKNATDCAKYLLFGKNNGYVWNEGEIIYIGANTEKIRTVYAAIDTYFKYTSDQPYVHNDYSNELRKLKTDKFKEDIKTIIRHFTKTRLER